MARKNWTYLDEFERKHRQLLGAIERRIQRSFQGLHLATSQVLENVPFDSIDLATGFDLSRFPYIEAQIDALTERTQKEILKTIQEAVRSTYAISTAKAIEMTTKYLGADASQLYIDTLQRAGSATAFQKQWFDNHPISERVWNITSQFKRNVEDRITTDLLNGVPADEVSRNIRGFLNEPNKLFRRVRGADGVLRLSKNARAYHPGQGVYRSSYKNARRLAVTEVNNAYRKADSDRWQQLDFVIGVRVQLSNNHTYRDHKGRLRTLVDICDDLKGDYPKDFVFTSWHPHCRCIATPILKSRAEMKADRERILRGEEPTPSPNEIKEMPANFKQWQKANASRIQGAMERDTLPHWYRDNQAVIGRLNYEDIATKLKEGFKPFQPNAYVSFEPFSPAIIEAIRKVKDRKAKNAIFESILNDQRANTLYTTKTAKTIIYPNHKGKRSPVWQETQEMAKALNEKGISVCFLPEMEEVRCADALLKVSNKKWMFADFKMTTSKNYNTIAEDIIDGQDQAKTIIIKATRIDKGIFNDVANQLKRKRKIPSEIILINKYNKIISLTYADIIKNNGKNKLKGFF